MGNINQECYYNDTAPILIVEDNSFNIIAITAVLEELGITDSEVFMNG